MKKKEKKAHYEGGGLVIHINRGFTQVFQMTLKNIRNRQERNQQWGNKQERVYKREYFQEELTAAKLKAPYTLSSIVANEKEYMQAGGENKGVKHMQKNRNER